MKMTLLAAVVCLVFATPGHLLASGTEPVEISGTITIAIAIGKRSPLDGPYGVADIRLSEPALLNGTSIESVIIDQKSDLGAVEDGDTIRFKLPGQYIRDDRAIVRRFSELADVRVVDPKDKGSEAK